MRCAALVKLCPSGDGAAPPTGLHQSCIPVIEPCWRDRCLMVLLESRLSCVRRQGPRLWLQQRLVPFIHPDAGQGGRQLEVRAIFARGGSRCYTPPWLSSAEPRESHPAPEDCLYRLVEGGLRHYLVDATASPAWPIHRGVSHYDKLTAAFPSSVALAAVIAPGPDRGPNPASPASF